MVEMKNSKDLTKMKKVFKSVLMLTAVLAAVVSCNKKEVDPQAPTDGYRYSFSVINDDTRALLNTEGVEWEAADQVGMYLTGYTGYAKLDVTTTPKSVILYSRQAIPANSYAYAYYPYSSDNGTDDKTATKIVLSNVQEGGANSAMPMVGIPFLVESEVPLPEGENPHAETNGQIKFLNLGSIIDFKVYSSTYSNETVQYVQFQADTKSESSGAAVVSGNGYLDLTAVDASDEGTLEFVFGLDDETFDYVKVNQEVPVANAKADATSIYMVVAPGTYSGTITIGTDVATYTFPYTNKELARNVLKHYNMNLNNATRTEGVVEVVKTLPYAESFTSGKGEFEIEGGNGYEWTFNSNYGATVTGYYQADGETEKQNHVANTSLVSPWIDLSTVVDAQMTFQHNRNGHLDDSEIALSLQKYGEETWTDLNLVLPSKPSNASSWSGWKNATVSLSDYVGQKVKVKFNYTSTQDVAGTYEFKDFLVSKVKVAAGISYAEADQSFTLNLGDDFTAPTLINPNNLTVTYSSSNEDVAAVNATSGAVTLGDEAGTAVITATFVENDDYLGATATYMLTVIDPTAIPAPQTIVFADLGLTSGQQYTEPFSGGAFTITFSGGEHDGKYYTTGSGIRTYTDGSITVASTAYNIVKIKYVFAEGNAPTAGKYTLNEGTLTTGNTAYWTGKAKSIVLTDNASTQWRLQSVTVTYEGYTAPVYTISIDPDIENGSVTASASTAEEDTEITLIPTADEGYHFASWKVTDASNNEITVTDNKFRMPASNVTVCATFEENANHPDIVITLNCAQNIFDLSTTNANDAQEEITKTVGDYSYKLFATNSCYYYGNKALLIGKSGSYITFPAISNYKLASVKASNCAGASAKATISIVPTDNTTAVSGGAVSTIAAGGSHTWTLTSTEANTEYRIYIGNANNIQYTEIVLTYKYAD